MTRTTITRMGLAALAITLLPLGAWALTEDTGWNVAADGDNNDDVALATATDQDGYTYVVGYINDNDGRDAVIRKYEPDGNEITIGWPQTFASGNGDDEFRGVAIGEDGKSVYTVGYGMDLVLDAPYPNGPSAKDWLVRKYESNGSIEWTKTYAALPSGWPFTLDDIANDVAYDLATDDIVVVGEWDGLGALTATDWRVLRLNGGDGSTVWSTSWSNTITPDIHDKAFGVAIDAARDAVYVVGEGADQLDDSPHSYQDATINRFEFSTGSLEWSRFWGKYEHDGAYDVAVDTSTGNLFVVGHMTETGSNIDGQIRSYEPDGDAITTGWPVVVDLTDSDKLYDVAFDDAGDRVLVVGEVVDGVSGASGRDMLVIELEDDSSLLDAEAFDGGESAALGVCMADDDAIVVGEGTELVSGTSDQDWWIKRFDP
jgi:hypothetical protein